MSPNTENVLGFFALVTYVATLLPSNLRAGLPALRPTPCYRLLVHHRRSIGIWTFVLSTARGYIAIHRHNLQLSTLDFYVKSISGLLILTIFLLLALTSNNWSIRRLKRNWKRLHSLTYVAAFLLPWHIVSKMANQWTKVTYVSIFLSVGIICLMGSRCYHQTIAVKHLHSKTPHSSSKPKDVQG